MKKINLTLAALPLFLCSLFAQDPNGGSNGLDFDGVDDYVQTPLILDATTFANWTLECWVKSPLSPTGANFSGPIYGEYLGIIWNHVSGPFQGAATVCDSIGIYTAVSFGPLQPNTWYHLAATYDGSVLTTYTNGVFANQATTNGGISNSSDTLTLGVHPTLPHFFTGTTADIRIWNITRTCTDINSTMNSSLSGSEAGLIANYNLNQGSAGGNNTSIVTVLDQSTNNNHGTPINFTLNGATSNFVIGAPFNNPIIPCSNSVDDSDYIFNNISIYPNPSQGTFNVMKHKLFMEPAGYLMMDVTGREVMTGRLVENNSLINCTSLPSGIYFFTVSVGDQRSTTKIILE